MFVVTHMQYFLIADANIGHFSLPTNFFFVLLKNFLAYLFSLLIIRIKC